ncbi:MAG: sodium:proton antiporter NhaD [Armatimonadota bacterium]
MAAPAAHNSASTMVNISSPFAWLALAAFVAAYAVVALEERLHVRKSVPMLLCAAVIWPLAAIALPSSTRVSARLEEAFLESGLLTFFLLSAMTYVNALEERQVFDVLRTGLLRRGFGLRAIYWITGALAFVLSPFLDNLTTALILGSVVISVAGDNRKFALVGCIHVVVAANAGGAVSPFGDITTLMVWQSGIVPATTFLRLLPAALAQWLIPAALMAIRISSEVPSAKTGEVSVRPGARVVAGLFAVTIALTVALHQAFHFPPAYGMMCGLGLLKAYVAWFRARRGAAEGADDEPMGAFPHRDDPDDRFDVFRQLQRVEWDTLLFFHGVLVAVAGLAAFGWLEALSKALYSGDPTWANTTVGAVSAVVDNIPTMAAVLAMRPEMSQSQWLLATYAAGTGGSLLAIGSAAGVALLGQSRGAYTSVGHLRWTWAVALGYGAGIAVHLAINGR